MYRFECKILLMDSMKQVEKFLDLQTTDEAEKKYPDDETRRNLHIQFERIRWRDALNFMWNGKAPALKKAFENELKNEKITQEERIMLEHLLNPKTYTEIYQDERTGLQNQPRISWNDEIKKIEEIDRIISYKTL